MIDRDVVAKTFVIYSIKVYTQIKESENDYGGYARKVELSDEGRGINGVWGEIICLGGSNVGVSCVSWGGRRGGGLIDYHQPALDGMFGISGSADKARSKCTIYQGGSITCAWASRTCHSVCELPRARDAIRPWIPQRSKRTQYPEKPRQAFVL